MRIWVKQIKGERSAGVNAVDAVMSSDEEFLAGIRIGTSTLGNRTC
jgi:hypothetical protein